MKKSKAYIPPPQPKCWLCGKTWPIGTEHRCEYELHDEEITKTVVDTLLKVGLIALACIGLAIRGCR